MPCGVITILVTEYLQEEKEHTQENKLSKARNRGAMMHLKARTTKNCQKPLEARKTFVHLDTLI